MTDSLVLGIDGGGSKTVALLAKGDGQIVGRGASGTSNYLVSGRSAALDAIKTAIINAFNEANLAARPADALCLGVAGVNLADEPDWLIQWAVDEGLARKVTAVDDTELVLEAGTPDGWGVGVISGTGSMMIGRNKASLTARAGGWGYLMGDEGSGYGIGVQALHAIAQAADGRGPKTALCDAILKDWNLRKPKDLIAKVYVQGAERREIAGLASAVARTAETGDRVAQEILVEAGRELAKGATAVAKAVGLSGITPCALTGGVLTHAPIVVEALIRFAGGEGITLEPINTVNEPAIGAVRLASKLLLR
jgi:N-acetylmuramic acid 6-phosphate etherase